MTQVITKTIEQMPHLYLDMDGVQADLFTAIAERENVTTWSEVTDPDQAITKLSLEGFESVYNLFRNLKPLNDGQILIKWLHDNKILFTVLSAPLRNENQASIEGKKDWLDQHNPGTSATAKFTKKKFQYAMNYGKSNVLVDDFDYYLNSWSEAGGIAIKHSDGTISDTLEKLETVYAQWLHK